jgi:uncharacterized membrane protein
VNFISDISKKEFPLSQKVVGKDIRPSIVDTIKKEFPQFNEQSVLAIAELNEFRNKYIQDCLTTELGRLSDLETQVLKSVKEQTTISGNPDDQKSAFGQRLADKVAAFGGSWKFIILFAVIIAVWMFVNIFVLKKSFDPYPFILLNLVLSCLAALQAPVIMMSQNRQEEKDRERSKNDYMINLKSELEIRLLHEKVDYLIVHQQERLLEIQQIQVDMMNDIMQRLER